MLVILSSLLSLSTTILLWLGLQVYAWLLRKDNTMRRKSVLRQLGVTSTEGRKLVGFFHPYCNAGGGGERVLWTAIAALQRNEPEIISVVYSGDIDATKDQILDKVKARFDIELDPLKIHFVFLHSRKWIEDSQWPYFTLLGQSLGSIYLAWEAMSILIPDLYIDTMGYAFTFRVASILGRIPVGAYVHYPTISTDMLARVRSRRKWHTNASAISSSAVLSKAKLLYYRIFMYHYASSLRTASFLMVNSSWTSGHVDSILRHSDFFLNVFQWSTPTAMLRILDAATTARKGKRISHARIVYPPCDTREMSSFALAHRQRVILSVAQFRPEKDHPTQLRAFAQLLNAHPEYTKSGVKDPVRLVLIGGSRNDEDARRVANLRRLAQELEWLSKASIGLSTMIDEHFGINVVEFMAAGVIPVAHASGGPLKDIIVPFNGKPTGYHAKTTEEFADALNTALLLSSEEELALRQRARTWAIQRFSEEEFEKGWNASGWKEWLLKQ
ncbi:glycosyltransferase family 4 protein [Macrolepiota fuliginosa MF-IS2]|uniref:GDP-Man:Man(3)GlcNAc(2)-PP-Dol alpha-1,2-mannosyltransferase n=1 Tax=Macrolepiota fuliginosa MF-IS2 TaxID=1400762 RepID=A0A9P5XKQ2_9AGAR|nr:glycosyltransferase family 4 protein [Macrolepiota fuliginosa MF-IS2]